MSVVTSEYVSGLAEIYRDLLAAFPKFEPARRAGYALAFGTLFEGLREKYSAGEVTRACEEMERGGAVKIKNGVFVQPTQLGEDIIAVLTGRRAPPEHEVPPFSPPPSAKG